jgi:GTP-binding protein HflX
MDIPKKNAVLVGIQLPKVSSQELESSLQELTRLVTTLGYNVVGQVTQKRSNDKSVAVLGAGKLKELAQWTGGTGVIASTVDVKLSKAAQKWKDAESDDKESVFDSEVVDEDEEELLILPEQKDSAQVVIVDTELSPSQIRNLESATGVTVHDRTGVIIEIFSRHAKTKTARLQVEIARLTYVAPRLRETGGGEDRGGGGVGAKGAGESSLELDKRKVRDRIKELKTELEAIGNQHQVRRQRRDQEISVALVGYTNAGKSSLMRAMTGSEVLVADKLFATLDTTIRPIYPETRPKVLLSDTVGFIKKLPHDLVASFKSTLDEALNASLLLFVVDSADPSFRSQLEVTKNVLTEVGAVETPSLLVLNKRDQLSEADAENLKVEFPEAVMISTRNKDDLKMLRDKIMSYFETDMIDEDLFVPYATQGVIGEIRAKVRVLGESYNERGVTLKVRSSEKVLSQIKKKLT